MENELKYSKGSYLQYHKDNPINWMVWGSKAFNLAQELDKPIFLSIGYFTCHWCHVMAREVFEDEEVAELLNKQFVCIKVDREELPDVDSFYIQALSILQGGNAGWPANLFLTPDLKPFFGFTYLPKKNFMTIVQQIAYLWKQSKLELIQYAEQVYQYLKENYFNKIGTYPIHILSVNNLEKFLYEVDKRIYEGLDEYGGFGIQPKFPPHQILEYLLYRFEDTPSKFVFEYIDKTLVGMMMGGMYDVIDGGFCRYSTDQKWMVPHFEKMLYDNALLMFIYHKASQIYQDIDRNKAEIFKYVSQTVLEFLSSFLYDSGAYLSSLSAESLDDGVYQEGAYYLFKPGEIQQINNLDLYYSVYEFYNPHTKYRGLILHYKEFPKHKSLNEILGIRNQLKQIRSTKSKPPADNKIIFSWNSMLCYYLLKCYQIYGYDSFLQKASEILDFLISKMFSKDQIYRICVDGYIYEKGMLEDYLWFSLATNLYYQITKKEDYLNVSRKIFDELNTKFFRDGIFYNSQEFLTYDVFDSSIHSNNSLALILALVLENNIQDKYKEIALKMFNFTDNVNHLGSFLLFLDLYKNSQTKVKSRTSLDGDLYKIYFDSVYEVKPSSIEIKKDEKKQVVLSVCQEDKCYEIYKTIEF
ncbi:MAG: DUF255 domain-containing protein [bacterium]